MSKPTPLKDSQYLQLRTMNTVSKDCLWITELGNSKATLRMLPFEIFLVTRVTKRAAEPAYSAATRATATCVSGELACARATCSRDPKG